MLRFRERDLDERVVVVGFAVAVAVVFVAGPAGCCDRPREDTCQSRVHVIGG